MTSLFGGEFAYVGPASDRAEALERLAAHTGVISVDTETVSIKDKRVIGLGVALSPVEAYYFCLWQGPEPYPWTESSGIGKLRTLLLRPDLLHLYWNVGFDGTVIEEHFGKLPKNFDDVSIMSHIQALPNALDQAVGHILLKPHQIISDILPKGQNMLRVDPALTAWKCMNDCMDTLRLWLQMKGPEWHQRGESMVWTDALGIYHDVSAQMKEVYWTDHDLVPVLWATAKTGILLDKSKVAEHLAEVNQRYNFYKSYCLTEHNFDPGSPQRVAIALTNRGNVFELPRGKKQLKVDEEALLACEDPLAHMILEYRKVQKLRGTYILPLEGQERFYTHFRLDLATGRTASFDRNVQNIPPSMRDMFSPDSGTFTWWDYSQIEMRIFAHIANSGPMLRAYETDTSVHKLTMETLWPNAPRYNPDGTDSWQYLKSKTFNFAMIYNAKDDTLEKRTGIPRSEVEVFKPAWLEKYEVGAWMEQAAEEGLNHGWVPGLDERRMRLPDLAMGFTENHVRNAAINYRVQGSAAVVLKKAWKWQHDHGWPVPAQVHDEFLIDGAEYEPPEEVLAELLPGIRTPFEVKRGTKWM